MLSSKILKAEILLLVAAIIWGLAFSAQRVGMEHVGPFTYNGARFILGALSLSPFLWLSLRTSQAHGAGDWRLTVTGSLLAGLFLFAGASLQQVGIVYTTAGKAGFITGLYVVMVPLLGLLWGQRTPWRTWIGMLVALPGLYLLTVTDTLSLGQGDSLVLMGTFFWAGHVLVIGWLSGRHIDPILLSFLQFMICGILSLLVAVVYEPITVPGLQGAIPAILYGGILSVGVAYTLQVIAQRDAPPAHAAIILSLETVFAVVGGHFLLHETLSERGIIGCVLMFAGMLISQFGPTQTDPRSNPAETTPVASSSLKTFKKHN